MSSFASLCIPSFPLASVSTPSFHHRDPSLSDMSSGTYMPRFVAKDWVAPVRWRSLSHHPFSLDRRSIVLVLNAAVQAACFFEHHAGIFEVNLKKWVVGYF